MAVRGFKIKDVPGDNNCQFHALADQLEQVEAAPRLGPTPTTSQAGASPG